MNKIIGWGIAVAGLLVFALSYPTARAAIGITIPANVGDLYITLIGVALMLGGAFLIYKGSKSEGPKEIPIYEGHGKKRKIVAIQRLGK
mgnify:CR=1 FL=1